MSYLVLARKYRPQTFEAVVDQEHVTRTLSNAISADRLAHAILFCGPRGTGKTTVARILAKAMNCEQGPSALPCNQCRSCLEITASKAVDVFEIDGASNNSVDQIRELRDHVKYMPAHGAYKIYIIDEVHMLSTPAFNALLKTLEEPPEHVLFFFATTEPHKIPVTILSRCQRHDFKRIRMDAIVGHLRRLCEQEGFEVTDGSLALIAREAGGSMRDALSLLDQITACAEDRIDDALVAELLGSVDRCKIQALIAAVLQRQASEMLAIVNDVYARGHDIKRLYREILEYLRNLTVLSNVGTPERLIDLPAQEIETMRRQIGETDPAHIHQVFQLLFQEEAAIRYSQHPRIALEMALFKILQAPPALAIETLIDRLDGLRQEFAGAGNTGPAPARDAGNQRVQATQPEISAGTAADPAAGPPPPTGDPADTWFAIRSRIAESHPSLSATLIRSTLKTVADDQIEIEVAGNGFHRNMIQRERNMEVIQSACRDVLGRPVGVKISVAEEDSDALVKKKKRMID
ncbi:MAG TPA: DNA polymerase III subunit gamma/tau [Desulfobacterales bacterium]